MDVNTPVDNLDAVIASHGSGLLAKIVRRRRATAPNAPSPLTPDEFDEVLKKLPQDP